MADPNFAAVMEMIAFYADVLDELESYTSTSSTGLLATVEACRNDLEGDWGQLARDGLTRALREVNGPLTIQGARRVFDPLLRQVAVAINYPAPQGPITDIWEALYTYMVDNSQTINDSEDTVDTSYSAGGSNVGNGEVIVLTVDEEGNKLGWVPDTALRLECQEDARDLGSTGVETWLLTGSDRRPDNLDTNSSGTGIIERNLRTLSADLSKPYVQNPSFNDATVDGSSNLTSLPGWTQNTGAQLQTNLESNESLSARATPGEGTDKSLNFTGDELIYQDLVVTGGARIASGQPFLIDIAVAKTGAPTGTVRLRVSGTLGSGGVTATLAHGAMTGSGTFDRLRIAVGANSWPKNFNANDLKLQIALESSGSIDASNYFTVDDILFTPLSRIGGGPRVGKGSMGIYLGIVGGSIPFVRGDVFTAGDTIGSTRGVNHWALTKIARYGALPMATGGTETIADK